MAEGAQPAGGEHWLAAAPPNLRANYIQKIMKIMAQFHGYQLTQLQQYQLDQLQDVISRYEATVFSGSGSMQDYLRTISQKMMSLRQKYQPVVQAASDHQQQAHMGHQMRPLDSVLASSPATVMPRTASTIPLPPKPPQVQNMQITVKQAQPSNVATSMQTVHPEQRSVGEVDWREDIFRKITSLKDAHLSELVEFERVLGERLPQIETSEQFKSLPPNEQADHPYRNLVNIMVRIRCILSFVQLQKNNIPEVAKDQFDKFQTSLYDLLQFYRESKARHASKNCHKLPQVINIAGATDNR